MSNKTVFGDYDSRTVWTIFRFRVWTWTPTDRSWPGLMKDHGQQVRAIGNFAGPVDFETPRPDLPVHFLNFHKPWSNRTGGSTSWRKLGCLTSPVQTVALCISWGVSSVQEFELTDEGMLWSPASSEDEQDVKTYFRLTKAQLLQQELRSLIG